MKILNKTLGAIFYGGFGIGFLVSAKIYKLKGEDIGELMNYLDKKADRTTPDDIKKVMLDTFDSVLMNKKEEE